MYIPAPEALGTASLSLKFEMWFQMVGFVLSSTVGKYYFYCSSIDERTSIFRKISHDVTFFSRSTII